MENIRWCRVRGIGQKHIFAHTDDGDVVMVSKNFTGMAEVQKGDVIQFVPTPFRSRTQEPAKPYFSVTWYALAPVIIARYFKAQTAVARPQIDAVAWKQRQEDAADHKFQETR